jgi:NADH pyrophosphatase NudC (nudix superfamily)
MSAELECHRGGKQMAMLHPVRKACPACGKPMKAVPDEASEGRPRYVCTNCNDDPLRDPNALKWAHGPLRPPEP